MAGMALSVPFSGTVLGRNDQINLAVIGLGSKVKIGGKGKGDLRGLGFPGAGWSYNCVAYVAGDF